MSGPHRLSVCHLLVLVINASLATAVAAAFPTGDTRRGGGGGGGRRRSSHIIIVSCITVLLYLYMPPRQLGSSLV
jgi:hypothetical protein